MQSLFLDQLRSLRRRPLILAHRGDSFHAPENTLDAAMLAWEGGADAWELDVRLTRDGVAVVLHDETLMRTTNVAQRFGDDPRAQDGFFIADFDWCEIAALDAGSWFVTDLQGARSAAGFGTLDDLPESQKAHFLAGKVRIPTLVDALTLTAQLDWLVNVEIKSFPEDPPGLVQAVLDAIMQTGTARRVLISSFDHRAIAAIPSLIPAARHDMFDIPRGILVASPLFRPHDYVTRIVGAQTYHASVSCLGSASVRYRRARSASALCGNGVAELKSRAIPILVFTVNDSSHGGLADQLAELGVDGLFSDDPLALRSHMG